MESQAPGRRQRVLDRHACQLVPECDPPARRDNDAGGEALVDRVRGVPADRHGELGVERRGRDRGRLDDGGRRRAQPRDAREHDVADRRGNLRPTDASTSVT